MKHVYAIKNVLKSFGARVLSLRKALATEEIKQATIAEAAELDPWPQNVLRHSRVSCRLAQTGDEVLTAAEDGHSAQMLHQHYRALVTAADAERYFGILPTPGLDLAALARAERERQDATRQAGLRRPNRVENFPSDSTGQT